MQDQAERPVQTYRALLGVLLALLALTALSIGVSRVDTGALRVIAALGISAVKTALVLYFFMHMRQAGKAVALAFLVTVTTLAVFIALTFLDVLYR